MITSIFSKSKPINFIIVAVYVSLLFVFSSYKNLFLDLNTTLFTLVNWVITLFLIFLLDFIVAKNNLTQRNSYAIMTFGLLLGVFPEVMAHLEILISNLFILFALRRLISLHTKLNIKKKLFDAAFWITIASFFFFWSILFFALVIVALIYYSQNDFKNVIVPFTGFIAALILFSIYNVIIYDEYFRSTDFERYASLDFTAYNSKENILRFTMLFSSFVWTLLYFFKNFTDKNKKLKPSYFLIAWTSIIAVLVAIIAPIKNGSEYLFLFVPFSIIMANYIEVISERWFKEVFIALFIIIPIVSLLL
ncbi:hypothetical protein HNV10_02770 [Winogradskyella litoriviva]|uniref:Beta-carotene 15,15'-monooxygenase n=1 Tax=Winogradskyella litoriviva TaxID=1220182 RepID=A0ABX2E200_9FLAO|nr:DUF6427 family protein [Winogradskyella litoriviva]NRD22147.1 hypothetical protein [Winogradskyella litoriviva]